jgi:hypothetical protein
VGAVRPGDSHKPVGIELDAEAAAVLRVTAPLAEKVLLLAEAADVNMFLTPFLYPRAEATKPFESLNVSLGVVFKLIENIVDELMAVFEFFVIIGIAGIREPEVAAADDAQRAFESGVMAKLLTRAEMLNQILAVGVERVQELGEDRDIEGRTRCGSKLIHGHILAECTGKRSGLRGLPFPANVDFTKLHLPGTPTLLWGG